MNIKFVVIFSLGLIVLASCATFAPFTEPMLKEFKLDTKNINNTQFYLSEEIVLFKIEETQLVGKEGSVFVKSEGGLSTKIQIKRNTACVVERIDKDGFFYVRFEEGVGKTLKFQRSTTSNDRYYLYTDFADNQHQVEYAKERYYVNRPSLIAFLMVQIKTNKKYLERRIITKGKRA